ncbi:hypothetical protein KM043_016062 [Ampulex compressa]|nr:hypothetical protein KM043_016062 [Ampulex compressa]
MDLDAYRESVELIKWYATKHKVSEVHTAEIFNNCFRALESKYGSSSNGVFHITKIILTALCALFLCLFVLSYQKSFGIIIARNLQNSIYPGLKILRKTAVPIIQYYPSLTELYDEWCLLENPFFHLGEMDCWPCSAVHSVPDLTDRNTVLKNYSFNIGIPYTRNDINARVNMKALSDLYMHNRDVFQHNTRRVTCNNATLKTIQDVIDAKFEQHPSKSGDVHVSWRINHMRLGRALRELFPNPSNVPVWWSQSIEKFVFIDEARSPPYFLPNPECSNVMISCTSGARLMKIVPSSECQQNCTATTILLSIGQTLSYNWWYWRPVSLPISSTTTISISYLTSFC